MGEVFFYSGEFTGEKALDLLKVLLIVFWSDLTGTWPRALVEVVVKTGFLMGVIWILTVTEDSTDGFL